MLCDTKGVVYQGRTEGMNQWKSAHAAATKARTLTDALDGADVVLRPVGEGRADQGRWSRAWRTSRSSSQWPIPIRRSRRRKRAQASPHAIIATGRSDYPNQVNNVLGFPYIFRGALDVRASTINEAMKIAAAEALAKLAREDVPDEVHTASTGRRLTFGAGLHHPERVRSAADLLDTAGGGPRRDGQRRRAQAADRSAPLRARACRAGSIPPPARSTRSWRTCAPTHAAWCSPRARKRRWCAPRSPIATPATAGRC